MVENKDIVDLITNRRSHRKYLSKEIPDEVLEAIINCGRNAPFGGKPKPDCQVTEYVVINYQKHSEDKKISREILHLPEYMELVVLLALGYKEEKEAIPEKELRSLEEVVHRDRYGG